MGTLTITLNANVAIASGDVITISGITGTQTADNAALPLNGADKAKFTPSGTGASASTAGWTQNTGTLVLTANTAVTAGTDIVVTISVTNKASAQSAPTVNVVATIAAGNIASSAMTGTNMATVDTTAPTFTSAQVANAAPTKVVITFSENIASGTTTAGDFAVVVVSSAATVSSAAIASGKVELTLSADVTNGQNISVAYTKSNTASQNIGDAANNTVATFTAQSVTNNVAAAPTPAPSTPAPATTTAAPTPAPKTTTATLSKATSLYPSITAFVLLVGSILVSM